MAVLPPQPLDFSSLNVLPKVFNCKIMNAASLVNAANLILPLDLNCFVADIDQDRACMSLQVRRNELRLIQSGQLSW